MLKSENNIGTGYLLFSIKIIYSMVKQESK